MPPGVPTCGRWRLSASDCASLHFANTALHLSVFGTHIHLSNPNTNNFHLFRLIHPSSLLLLFRLPRRRLPITLHSSCSETRDSHIPAFATFSVRDQLRGASITSDSRSIPRFAHPTECYSMTRYCFTLRRVSNFRGSCHCSPNTCQESKLDRAVSSLMAARPRLLYRINLVHIQPVRIVALLHVALASCVIVCRKCRVTR